MGVPCPGHLLLTEPKESSMNITKVLPLFLALFSVGVLAGCKEGSDAARSQVSSSNHDLFDGAERMEKFVGNAVEQSGIEELIGSSEDEIALQETLIEPEIPSPFRLVGDAPLSSFGIDVDGASYSNVRGYLSRGQVPPPGIVRVEELVNYFDYDYPQPVGEHPFAFSTEVGPCPWNGENRLVRIGLQGREINAADAPPSNLVFLIDVSGSMGDSDKLGLLKKSFHAMVDQLREQDRVSIVTYAGSSALVLPSTSGAEKDEIREAIEDLRSGGSTAGGEGIRTAYEEARRNFDPQGNNRVILATDGDFNVGVSSRNELVNLVEGERNVGIYLSVLGFGTGNYQDYEMEALADNGNGNYFFIDSEEEGERVLVDEMVSTILTIATDVKIQVGFNPSKVAAYRLIGYENRALTTKGFDDDRKDAGDLGAGTTVTALYEIVPHGRTLPAVNTAPVAGEDESRAFSFSAPDLMGVRLRYKNPGESKSRLLEHAVSSTAPTFPSSSFTFAASVAEWGLLLKGDQYAPTATYERVIRHAALVAGEDRWRKEFVRMVTNSVDFVSTSAPQIERLN